MALKPGLPARVSAGNSEARRRSESNSLSESLKSLRLRTWLMAPGEAAVASPRAFPHLLVDLLRAHVELTLGTGETTSQFHEKTQSGAKRGDRP